MSDLITIKLDDPSILYLSKKDKRLAKVIKEIGPISYTIHTDGYAFLVHEIIEQMLSIKAGAIIYSRLTEMCDGKITPAAISNLSDEQIKTIGTSKNKISYIRALTEKVISGQLDLKSLEKLSDSEVTKELTSIKGIGNWTSKMYLIFVLNRPDVLPIEDVAFLQSFRWMMNKDNVDKNYIISKCKKWSPYSSTAARYMYKALDSGLTKNRFHLYKEGI